MIHRTFRSLDEAPRLVAFTIRQWAMLIAGCAAVFGLIHLSHLPTKPAITLCVFVIGLPAALMYVSESGGLQLGVLLRDMCRWRLSRHTLPAASHGRSRARSVLVLASTEPSDPQDGNVEDPALDELICGERWG
ncbi:MAG: PrgI family protein [Solirubrobacteraceae bacterium]